jgi:hypothetical protein
VVDFDWTVMDLSVVGRVSADESEGSCRVDPSLRRHDPDQVQGSPPRWLDQHFAVSQPLWWGTPG